MVQLKETTIQADIYIHGHKKYVKGEINNLIIDSPGIRGGPRHIFDVGEGGRPRLNPMFAKSVF